MDKSDGCKPPKLGDVAEIRHQIFEHDSPLQTNANLDLVTLRERIPEGRATVRYYVMPSLVRSKRDGALLQTGSGPNIEGGLITLCTCKHGLRTWSTIKPGVWLAGFTSHSQNKDEHNVLFYLTRIGHAFESQRALWNFLDERVQLRKSTRHNPLGDLFEPLTERGDPHDPRSYHAPRSDHSHMENSATQWHKDIVHRSRYGGRPAAMLVGDPTLSFVWTRPMFERENAVARNPSPSTLSDFLAALQPHRGSVVSNKRRLSSRKRC